MSSKNGEEGAGSPRSPSSSSYWSISGRLTTHYAVAAFLLLGLSSAILYVGLVKSLERQSNRFLQDQINVAGTLLETAKDEAELLEDFEVEFAARELSKSFARIVDKDGKILLQTYRMGQAVPVSAFPRPGEHQDQRVKWKSAAGRSYQLKSAWVTVGGAGSERRILQVAQDISYMERILKEYRVILSMVIALGTILSAGVGAFMVGRALQPIEEMAERTRHITAFNLNERINLEHWPAELKELGLTFDDMLNRLKKAFDRLSDHVSILAHELRNPINVLLGEAEVVLTRERDAGEYRKVIESSIEEFGRLSRMIDSLLFIARFDIKESALKREEIDVCHELTNIADFYGALGEDKEIVVQCHTEVWLFADSALFRRAVGNLLSNALRYTPAGGRISLAGRYAEDLSVEVTVSDTGCGIREEDLPHIFDRFYRAEATKNLAPEGTGLGLAIVKSIMEHHGGTITIDSAPSRGTSVTLRFPLPEDYEHVINP